MLAAMARTGAGTTRSEYAKSCAVEALQVLSGQSCESSVQHATAIMQLRHATATHKCTMDLRNKKKAPWICGTKTRKNNRMWICKHATWRTAIILVLHAAFDALMAEIL